MVEALMVLYRPCCIYSWSALQGSSSSFSCCCSPQSEKNIANTAVYYSQFSHLWLWHVEFHRQRKSVVHQHLKQLVMILRLCFLHRVHRFRYTHMRPASAHTSCSSNGWPSNGSPSGCTISGGGAAPGGMLPSSSCLIRGSPVTSCHCFDLFPPKIASLYIGFLSYHSLSWSSWHRTTLLHANSAFVSAHLHRNLIYIYNPVT